MIRFYLDGNEVFSAPTPADMHKPMFMLANLAVTAAAAGDGSATMTIDHIRAYRFKDLALGESGAGERC